MIRKRESDNFDSLTITIATPRTVMNYTSFVHLANVPGNEVVSRNIQ